MSEPSRDIYMASFWGPNAGVLLLAWEANETQFTSTKFCQGHLNHFASHGLGDWLGLSRSLVRFDSGSLFGPASVLVSRLGTRGHETRLGLRLGLTRLCSRPCSARGSAHHSSELELARLGSDRVDSARYSRSGSSRHVTRARLGARETA